MHGLWPQNANARSVTDHPRFCKGDLAPLPVETLEPYLSISPGAKLLQGEWENTAAALLIQPKIIQTRESII